MDAKALGGLWKEVLIAIAPLTLAALLIAVLFSILIIRRMVTKPLKEMTQGMTRLAGGDLSTETPVVDRDDEIGHMSKALQVFKENALESRRHQQERREAESRARAERRQAMVTMAEDLEGRVSKAMQSITELIDHLHGASDTMSANALQTSDRSSAVSAATKKVTESAGTASEAGGQLTTLIAEMAAQMLDVSNISSEAVTETERANEKMHALAEAAGSIDQVLQLITEIAGQTQMLALNATIEAARAGEAGKGFAVVAAEVKTLARQTTHATEEISDKVGAIQTETREAVPALERIGDIIEKVNHVAHGAAAAMQEQDAASSAIANHVSDAATGADEVSRNIATVAEAARATENMAKEVQEAAATLLTQNRELEQGILTFIEELRREGRTEGAAD